MRKVIGFSKQFVEEKYFKNLQIANIYFAAESLKTQFGDSSNNKNSTIAKNT